MIKTGNKIYILHTLHTTYAFRIMDTGCAEHLYYGRRVNITPDENGISALTEKHAFAPGNTVTYDKDSGAFSMEDVCLELSATGKGDMREPAVMLISSDGSRTGDFVYKSFETGSDIFINDSGMPKAHLCDEQLVITYEDKNSGASLQVCYKVFEDEDVITRSVKIINDTDSDIIIDKLMSLQIDFDRPGFKISSFTGGWAREMNREDTVLNAGKFVVESRTGTSSNRANPFFMMSDADTNEDAGDVYGFNLIYSGNHYESISVSSFGKTRVLSGINPEGFSWTLHPSDTFVSPEAVMTFSHRGYNNMSHHMHAFVRKHIVRKEWQRRKRLVLLNSWEAAYFDINESKLLKLASKAAEAGIELFVMDDGWFGERDNDAKSLGDWTENKKKLPGGLKGLTDKVKALGLKMGIWVEPEMVNTDSSLYKKHPEWCLAIPGKDHSEGRNQRMLDLSRPEVVNFITEEMTRVFSSADISYVKWDMNRVVSDVYSSVLPPEKQGEVMHRYVLGLYKCMKTLTERFPEILFEGCASGGNRFDLGILSYFPQIWGSDNTDALSRAVIQSGYSYGYPLECVGAHVSGSPNHQTLRRTPLESRFAVASFGSLGYECNLCDMSKEEADAIKSQVELYKKWRNVFQDGIFYRGRSFADGNINEWTMVSRDRKAAVGMVLQDLVKPNTQYLKYNAKGLLSDVNYRFTNRELKYDIRDFGDLVNTVSPVHLKQDSIALDVIAKLIKMDGEEEDITVSGDVLMHCGVKLKQAFSGTGYNEQVRFFPDFSARMYFMNAI